MKIFVYVLDGCTFKKVGKYIDEGTIPFLKKVKEEGSWGICKSVFSPATCPAIPSFYTGKNVGKHGLRDTFTSDGKINNSLSITEKKLWEYLGDENLRSVILNLGYTYPVQPLNGVMFSGFLTPSKESNHSFPEVYQKKYDWPVTLKEEVSKNTGLNKIELAGKLTDISRQRFQVFNQLLSDEKFDFALFHSQGCDTIQHHFWDEEEKIVDFYNDVCENIQKIHEKHKPDMTFLISDHGFEQNPEYNFNVFAWLSKEGYFKVSNTQKFLLNKIKPFIKKFKLAKASRKVAKIKSEKEKLVGVDWEKTSAYAQYMKPIGIYLTKPEDPNYENLRNEIIDKLKELKFNSKPVIKEIHKREEVFSGKFMKELPDIVFLTENFGKNYNPYSNEIFTKNKDKLVPGKHINERDGVFFAYGKGIKKGFNINVSLLDILPTILHCFNIPIPKDLDGEVLDVLEGEMNRKVEYQKELQGKKELDEALKNIKL